MDRFILVAYTESAMDLGLDTSQLIVYAISNRGCVSVEQGSRSLYSHIFLAFGRSS